MKKNSGVFFFYVFFMKKSQVLLKISIISFLIDHVEK